MRRKLVTLAVIFAVELPGFRPVAICIAAAAAMWVIFALVVS